MSARSRAYVALVALATLAAAWLVATRVRLSPDVAELLPDRGEAAALARYARAFGGGDPGLVLLEGDDRDELSSAADDLVEASRGAATIESAYARMDLPYIPTASQWMLLADKPALARVAAALTAEGMRERLLGTRALLLAPGGGTMASSLSGDPLRIGELVLGGHTASASPLVSADGRARVVVLVPRGNALRSEDARLFVAEAEARLSALRARHPTVRARLTGGHALAAATESLLRRDLVRSSVLSVLLVAVTFVLFFRRARALVAILPPLAAGTILTAAVAALFPRGLSAIAVAFASVVVGVGTDTGVHVYAAVRAASEEGHADPAAEGRRRTARAVLGAAAVAASAFACLALSRVDAMRQLGILSAVGEVTTALAILAVTPAMAAWLERRRSPSPSAARWAERVAGWPRRSLAVASVTLALLAVVAVALGLGPHATGSLVLVRPRDLPPAAVYADLHRLLGTTDALPFVVLIDDTSEESARARADRIHEGLAREGAWSVDSLLTLAPSAATVAARRQRRDTLDLPARAADLSSALAATGFAPLRFAAALDDLRAPSSSLPEPASLRAFARRYLAEDGGAMLSAVYVQAGDGASDALSAAVGRLDPRAEVTGYARLEPALRSALARDLPRVGAAALVLVLSALALTLRRARDVALALLVVVTEIALVMLAMRALDIPLHAYDALVLPVLLGITLDEVLFVLFAVREHGGEGARRALAEKAPLVVTTALTTAAGFGALIVCRFDALRHLAVVGAVGSAIGVVLALVVVPSLVLTPWGGSPGGRGK